MKAAKRFITINYLLNKKKFRNYEKRNLHVLKKIKNSEYIFLFASLDSVLLLLLKLGFCRHCNGNVLKCIPRTN